VTARAAGTAWGRHRPHAEPLLTCDALAVRIEIVGRDLPGRRFVSGLRAEIDLTDERGGPRCARVRPPAVRWSLLT